MFCSQALVLPPCSHGYISEHLCGSFSPKCGELSCFSYVMSSLPTPPQLKCNYHLADTKMRFLACGLSRCYLEFLNFRQARRRKKKAIFLSLLPSYFLRVSRKGREEELYEKGGGQRGRGEGEKRRERDDRKREVRESFWEDVIMRTVNSVTGSERERLARQQGDAVHRFSALYGCQ